MKNYIEVEHYHVDSEGDENWDVLYAVRPSDSRFKLSGETDTILSAWHCGWDISGGSRVAVGSASDLAGLRKLLDAIEVELNKEQAA